MSQGLGLDGKGWERWTAPGDTGSWGFIFLGDFQAGK